jgi:transposase, IS5 family
VDGAPRVDLAVPAFGYKNHLGIDRRHRLIRRWTVTDAARHDGALLPELIDRNNTAGDVWADTVYRSRPMRSWTCCILVERHWVIGRPVFRTALGL